MSEPQFIHVFRGASSGAQFQTEPVGIRVAREAFLPFNHLLYRVKVTPHAR